MIAYFKCICRSADKLLAKRLRDRGYEVRDIRMNPDWRTDARSYNHDFPFIVEKGIAKKIDS